MNFAKDGITRRMLLTYQEQPLLPIALAALVRPEVNVKDVRGRFSFYKPTKPILISYRPNPILQNLWSPFMITNFRLKKSTAKLLLLELT